MIASPINTSFDDNVLRIALAEPAAGNLFNDAMLGSILAALEKWNSAKVVLLTAEGPDFSIGRPRPRATSGLAEADAKKVRAALELVHAINMKLRDWPGASMAVLRGQAKGAAAGLIINCDVVIAESGASIGYPEMTHDLPPAIVASYLPNRIGARIAQYMLLTGTQIDMKRALAWGLVHEVHAPEGLASRAEEILGFLAARAPGAINHCKRSLYAFANQPHAVAGPRGVNLVLEWLCRPAVVEKS